MYDLTVNQNHTHVLVYAGSVTVSTENETGESSSIIVHDIGFTMLLRKVLIPFFSQIWVKW